MAEDLSLSSLTQDWGSPESVELYLDRCQVDTPSKIVAAVWRHIQERRDSVRAVVDFGAGDGRFAYGGNYEKYVGYEIDVSRFADTRLPSNASLVSQCAFSAHIETADVCVGNPPYVRNQDLPVGWRQEAAACLFAKTGVRISGLANAWQYFFLLALASTKADGLVALIIPYEWVSRPSAASLRDYIRAHGWNVMVYRLLDDTFNRVLTTSSITIVDKRCTDGEWKFYEESPDGTFRALSTEAGSESGVLAYANRQQSRVSRYQAKRGLSPGTQEVLTLTEGERVHSGLVIDRDVVPCITSLRGLDPSKLTLTQKVFDREFRMIGAKCWLVRTDRKPSARLQAYFDSISSNRYQTATCLQREKWWQFSMPDTPSLLVATGFRGTFPKVIVNAIGAKAVGGVSGVFGVPQNKRSKLAAALRSQDVSERIISHSNGLKKIEINQLNTLLQNLAI